MYAKNAQELTQGGEEHVAPIDISVQGRIVEQYYK